jgi:hypothetical protein
MDVRLYKRFVCGAALGAFLLAPTVGCKTMSSGKLSKLAFWKKSDAPPESTLASRSASSLETPSSKFTPSPTDLSLANKSSAEKTTTGSTSSPSGRSELYASSMNNASALPASSPNQNTNSASVSGQITALTPSNHELPSGAVASKSPPLTFNSQTGVYAPGALQTSQPSNASTVVPASGTMPLSNGGSTYYSRAANGAPAGSANTGATNTLPNSYAGTYAASVPGADAPTGLVGAGGGMPVNTGVNGGSAGGAGRGVYASTKHGEFAAVPASQAQGARVASQGSMTRPVDQRIPPSIQLNGLEPEGAYAPGSTGRSFQAIQPVQYGAEVPSGAANNVECKDGVCPVAPPTMTTPLSTNAGAAPSKPVPMSGGTFKPFQ